MNELSLLVCLGFLCCLCASSHLLRTVSLCAYRLFVSCSLLKLFGLKNY